MTERKEDIRAIGIMVLVILFIMVAGFMMAFLDLAWARDDGRYANSLRTLSNRPDAYGFPKRIESENLPDCSAIVEAVEGCTFTDPVSRDKVVEIVPCPIKFNFDASSAVTGLFLDGCPSAVVGGIRPIIVTSFQSQTAMVGWTHIGMKINEVAPAFANLNAASSVRGPIRIARFGASVDHRVPNGDKREMGVVPISGDSHKSIWNEASVYFTTFHDFLHYVRDDSGKYKESPLRSWFDSLTSEKGPCCSYADGFTVTDADWESRNGHYRVRVPINPSMKESGPQVWIDVPDEALIKVPNLAQRTIVWPFYTGIGIEIRCFMPGSMT